MAEKTAKAKSEAIAESNRNRANPTPSESRELDKAQNLETMERLAKQVGIGATTLHLVESMRAAVRRNSKLKQGQSPVQDQRPEREPKGQTRDIVAEKVAILPKNKLLTFAV